MAGTEPRNGRYAVHGNDVASLVRGFNEIGMPEQRMAAALEVVREVAAVNEVTDFYWYCTPSTSEICCFWNGSEQNQMWINTTGVVLREDGSLAKLPERARDYFLRADRLAGWLLPGAEMGSGGGLAKRDIPPVNCPVTLFPIPAGSLCPDCEIVHS